MKIVYVPLYRCAVSYTVSFGRRWSVLEHLILVELSNQRRAVSELVNLSNLPDRLVIEALTNLLRASYIEVRTSETGVTFTATKLGQRRASNEMLPSKLARSVRWASLCADRVHGGWIRAEDLDLVYDRDLPPEAFVIEPRLHTYDPNDSSLRDLLALNPDEALEPVPAEFRTASRPYARVEVAFGGVHRGLPSYTSLALKDAVLRAAELAPEHQVDDDLDPAALDGFEFRDEVRAENLIVGGEAHRELLRTCLENTASHIIIHSCFLSGETVTDLLPEFERAAKRKVKIELLWGLNFDPESEKVKNSKSSVEGALNGLSPSVRAKVQLSPISSGSHAKVIVYDERTTGRLTSIVGSCNFLSSNFDWMEVSLVSRSQGLARSLLGYILASQLPPAGPWSPTARRINNFWSRAKVLSQQCKEEGSHTLTLLVDSDHYACVTRARDMATKAITLACDLYGVAAETSVLVPMVRALELNKRVQMYYSRPSKFLHEAGRAPGDTLNDAQREHLHRRDEFHAKFLLWDDGGLAITSFNWLSTVTDASRSRGAELGILVEGSGAASAFKEKIGISELGELQM